MNNKPIGQTLLTIMAGLFGDTTTQLDPWATYMIYCRYAHFVRNNILSNQGFVAKTSNNPQTLQVQSVSIASIKESYLEVYLFVISAHLSKLSYFLNTMNEQNQILEKTHSAYLILEVFHKEISQVFFDFPQISENTFSKILLESIPEKRDKKLTDFEKSISYWVRFLITPKSNLDQFDPLFVSSFNQIMAKILINAHLFELLEDFDSSYCEEAYSMLSHLHKESQRSSMFYQLRLQELKELNPVPIMMSKPSNEEIKAAAKSVSFINKNPLMSGPEHSKQQTHQTTQFRDLNSQQTQNISKQDTTDSSGQIKSSLTGKKPTTSKIEISKSAQIQQTSSFDQQKTQISKSYNRGTCQTQRDIPASTQVKDTNLKPTQDPKKQQTQQQKTSSFKPHATTKANIPYQSLSISTTQQTRLQHHIQGNLSQTSQDLRKSQNLRQLQNYRPPTSSQNLTQISKTNPSTTGNIKTADIESVIKAPKKDPSELPSIIENSGSSSNSSDAYKNYLNQQLSKPDSDDHGSNFFKRKWFRCIIVNSIEYQRLGEIFQCRMMPALKPRLRLQKQIFSGICLVKVEIFVSALNSDQFSRRLNSDSTNGSFS
eukprot:403376647